jgi:Tol biopolymer transport system component
MSEKKSILATIAVVLTVLFAGGAALLVTSVPARAAFPGENGAIAFSREEFLSQVYSMNPDGSDQTRLTADAATFDGTWNDSVAWAPSGKELAFTHGWYRYLDSEIYLMNADGTGAINLTDDDAWDRDPSWFPGGEKIAYVSDRTTDGSSGDVDIYALPVGPGGGVDEPTRITKSPKILESAPAVSPDGTRIAFERDGEIYVMRAEPQSPTNRPERLTRTAIHGDEPNWSPDGARIAFANARGVDPDDGMWIFDIYVMNADGSGKTNLTRTPGVSEIGPAFSPNGKNMAFASSKDRKDYDIWRMKVDGSAPTQLTDDPADHPLYESGPDWQPLP